MSKIYKLIIFDGDGTLRECTVPGQPCPNKPGEWKLMSNVKETLARYDWTETALGIASNQAGIALGFLDQPTAYQLLADMVVEATGFFPPTGSIQLCPHGTKDGCGCRKPEPGMLHEIMRFWGVYPSETLYVGDMESDKLAAAHAGSDFRWAYDFFRSPSPRLSAEDEKFLGEAMEKMFRLMDRKVETCFRCDQPVKAMEQIGRCVYARPCGCRLWQGKVPEAWKKRS